MGTIVRIVSAAGLFFATVSAADSKHQINRNVKSGEANYISDNFNCKGGAVSAAISTPPAHGTAKVVVVTEAVSSRKLKTSGFLSCEGKVTKIYYIQYKSNAGYKGKDVIGIRWSGSDKEFNYKVNVK